MIGDRVRNAIRNVAPWTNVYGLARSLIALGTLGTLVFSHSTSIFRRAVGIDRVPQCSGLAHGSYFCLFGSGHLELARWIAVVLLTVVVTGWRPRFTGIVHWWLSVSLAVSGVLVDGGDQVAQVLTLLLLPVTVTDRRKWHWQRAPTAEQTGELARLVAVSALLIIRIQVAAIYFHAAVAKMAVTEWRNGTAVYYWFTDPMFGLPEYLRPIVMPVITHGVGVTLLTWGPMLLETLLFMALLMEKRHRWLLFYAGISFHAAIAVVHGLLSFAFAMWGALILFLRPIEKEFSFAVLVHRPDWTRALMRRTVVFRTTM
ncbi:MAG TPA: sporulation-delaying protein SdpB family protein [Gemmatimonadaceae bacterium]